MCGTLGILELWMWSILADCEGIKTWKNQLVESFLISLSSLPVLLQLGNFPQRDDKAPGGRVSKYHRLTVVQLRKMLMTLRKILRCVCAIWKIHDFIYFLNFLLIFTHFMRMSRDFLAIFQRKVFKSKIVAAQKIHC